MERATRVMDRVASTSVISSTGVAERKTPRVRVRALTVGLASVAVTVGGHRRGTFSNRSPFLVLVHDGTGVPLLPDVIANLRVDARAVVSGFASAPLVDQVLKQQLQ
jgi:hypothetical protein